MKIIGKLCAVCLLITGCSSYDDYSILEMKDTTRSYRQTGSIAVLAARNTKFNLELAKKITEGLNEKSTLKVIQYTDVTKSLGKESADITSGKQFNEDEIVKQASVIRKTLNVDYVYVVIVGEYQKDSIAKNSGGMSGTYSVDYTKIPIKGYLIEYPENKIIGETNFLRFFYDGYSENSDDMAIDTLNTFAENIVFKITKRLGYKK